MRPTTVSLTGDGVGTTNSTPIVVSWRANPTSISLFFTTTGATTNFLVQYTGDDPNLYADAATYNSAATWYDHPFMAAMVAADSGNIAYPVRAIRLQANNAGTDTGSLTIIQSGVGD